MARKASDPTARIAQLKAARAKFVKSKIKGPLNGGEMAQAVQMSWRWFKQIVDDDDGFPCLLRGSEGSPYQFDPRPVFDHMIKRLQEQLQDRSTRNRRLAEVAGISPELADSGMSLEEIRMLDAIQVSTQRRKIEQRLYVQLAEHEAVIADVFSTIQAEVLSTAGRLDPSGRWQAAIRNQVREEMRNLLVRLHDRLGARLNGNAGTARGNRRGARASRA